MLVLRPELVDIDKMRDADGSRPHRGRRLPLRGPACLHQRGHRIPVARVEVDGASAVADVVAPRVSRRAAHSEKPPLAKNPIHRTTPATTPPTARLRPTTTPRADIVNAATKLFSEQGYAQTTMSDIARASGLSSRRCITGCATRNSCYRRRCWSTGAAEVSSPRSVRLRLAGGQLYRLLRFDTMQPALSPIDFNEIQRIAHEQRTEFHQSGRDYERRLKDGSPISSGRDQRGQFIDCDAKRRPGLLLNFDEGAQKRTRLHTDQGDRGWRRRSRVGEQVAIIAVRAACSTTE